MTKPLIVTGAGIGAARARRCAPEGTDMAHLAENLRHMASLPLSADILFQTIMATKMPLVGRG